jgi:hypothetical protein
MRSMVSIEECNGGLLSGIAVNDLDELPHRGDGFATKSACDGSELDHVGAPLPILVLCDERLWSVEVCRCINPGKTAILPQVAQEAGSAWRARWFACCD